MISRDEVLMGRQVEFPLTDVMESNLSKLLEALNKFRALYGKPMIVSSGYRPGYYNKNAGGAPTSAHLTCEACDFKDFDGAVDDWCTDDILEQCGLYREDPDYTHGWIHLTTKAPKSGNRTFLP